MKIVTITSLFPYASDPKHGIFIETRLRQLLHDFPDVEAKVIAPIPFFPLRSHRFGHYADFAAAPKMEIRHGIEVWHPRYMVIPKIGMRLAPASMAHAIYRQASQMIRNGFDFDLIDGHYFYPDGVAIARVAARLHKPFTVTARGTDINLIPEYAGPKRRIQEVFQRSDHMMAVCDALRHEMIALGAPTDKVTTLRNGVDLELFRYTDASQQKARRNALGLPPSNRLVLSVGHLIERKGHALVIEAVSRIPGVHLLIAGDGPDKKKLQALSIKTRTVDRVHFLGSLSQTALADYYGAADLLVLASSREGWANVLLEAMACGTPVVATRIWGTPEVVTTKDAGLLVDRNPASIRHAIEQLLNLPPDRRLTRQYAEQFTWLATSQKQYDIFTDILSHWHSPQATHQQHDRKYIEKHA